MGMTLTQLRTFLAVAQTGSVRAAAEQLVVSQPSVSAAVGSLQRELGVELFARQGRGLRMTAAGAAFAAGARASLGLLDQATRRAQSIDEPGHGSVRVVAITTAAERLVLPLIAGFLQRNPAAKVTVHVGNRTTAWEALRDHEADLVVAGRPPASAPARVLGTAENRLVVVGPAADPSGRRAQRAEHWLAGRTWLMREEGSGTRDATESLFESLGIRPPCMILGSNGAVERAVAAGLGVALISLSAVIERIQDGSVVVLACRGTPLDRPWHLVAHSSEPLNPTATQLVRSMGESKDGFALSAEGRRLLISRARR